MQLFFSCWVITMFSFAIAAWQENVRPKMYVQLGKLSISVFFIKLLLLYPGLINCGHSQVLIQ